MQYMLFALLAMLGLEIVSIVVVAHAIGVLAILMLMIVSFILGSFIMRRTAGLSSLLMGGAIFRSGSQLSLYQMLWPIRLPAAAFLLMVPGFFSSIIALILLLPFQGKSFSGSAHTQTFEHTFDGFTRTRTRKMDDEDVIDGDFVVKNTEPERSQTKRQIEIIEHRG